MTFCPICKVNELIEDAGGCRELERLIVRNDCPGCGSYRIDRDAEVYAFGLQGAQVEQLQDWIRRRNAEADVPLIKQTLIAKI